MIKIDRSFINHAILKWTPVINSLNIGTHLIEPISIFAEVHSYKNNNNLYSSNYNIFTDYILPMSIKILSKLNLSNVKLIIDTENNYTFDDYYIKFNLTTEQEQELNMQVQVVINPIDMAFSALSNEIIININDKIKNEKFNILIINDNFINKIERFPTYILLTYNFILTGIKQERLNKLKEINSNI